MTETSFDEDTDIICIKRDHPCVNGYNKWISMIMRANHVLTIIHYVMKYISKPNVALHSKLTIAAAVRKALPVSPLTTDLGRKMILKTYNKLDSHREVGIPEAISHLLAFPDHYINKKISAYSYNSFTTIFQRPLAKTPSLQQYRHP